MDRREMLKIAAAMGFALPVANAAESEWRLELPPPRPDGGILLMNVLKNRHSAREFSRKPLPPHVLDVLLAANITVQTDYIISRSRGALPKILAAAPASERAKIEANYRKVATTSQGTYALIDYVNFKGDGTQTSERYNGYGWGLMQVLGGMKEVPAGPAAASEFAASAKRVLSRRVSNAPAARNEGKWLPGWHNRCDTYARPL